jgi:epoxyqueuosine reductase
VSADDLTNLLKQEAIRLGFDLVGACPAVSPAGYHRLRDWIDAGYAGEMSYLPGRLDAYKHPDHVLDGTRSLIMLGMHYRTAQPIAPTPGLGRISRYAWGPADYHDIIHERLAGLREFLVQQAPDATVRGVVDTAPLLEREFARLAGLGWIGKNTMLIDRQAGSWFFLAALLTDLQLTYDASHEADHCGTCRACLDACPTGAFPRPGVLDATKCISYLTIELRGSIPVGLRDGLGDWLFGCDICQEVCPWNRHAPLGRVSSFFPEAMANPVSLVELFNMTDAEFRQRFRRTPLWRAKRRGILRNAAIVLGNQRAAAAIGALAHGLNDGEPVVRAACAWALGRLQNAQATEMLRGRLARETDPLVRDEIEHALNGNEPASDA